MTAKEYAMLVLTRKTEETIQIGQDITITILRIKGKTVKIGVEASQGMPVLRGELLDVPEGRPAPAEPAAKATPTDSKTTPGELPADEAVEPSPDRVSAASLPRRRAPCPTVAPDDLFTRCVGPASLSPRRRGSPELVFYY
jgi:carbon storage regulator CsrA